MKKNVGSVDKIVRGLVGMGLLTFAFVGPAPASYFGWIGVVPLLTALFGYCPLYSLIGIRTCPVHPMNTKPR